MPWHAHSSFTAGPRQPRSRDQRRLWLVRVDLQRRAGILTALHALIAAALLKRLSVDGRLDPSYETLSADTGACPRTVGTALRRLRWVGLIGWQRRLARVGRAVRQWSNSYEISLTGSTAAVAFATKRRIPRPVLKREVAVDPEWEAKVMAALGRV